MNHNQQFPLIAQIWRFEDSRHRFGEPRQQSLFL